MMFKADRLLLISMLSFSSAAIAAPAIIGPEVPQDWMRAGQAFTARSKAVQPNRQPARNVILFIGDGMGITTQTAARIFQGQQNGKPGEENSLSFETFPYMALSKTYSWDQQTSDSAPTISAIVTGYKTREGMLSVDHTTARHEGNATILATKTVPTILELAALSGRDVGIVSTARITHATPGGHYAHTAARDWESDLDIRQFEQKNNLPVGAITVKDIAQQLIELDPRVLPRLKLAWGGGRTMFMPSSATDPESGKPGRRVDNRDLIAQWKTTRGNKANYVWNKAGFDAIDPRTTGPVLALFEDSHMQYEADRKTDKAGEPSLTEMTSKAIAILQKNKKGYYLHIEAGRIDHGHHAGNAYRALTDTVELSNAVRQAVSQTDPRDTLIIVTADHSHTLSMSGYPARGNPILGLARGVPDRDGEPANLILDKQGLPFTTLNYANGSGFRERTPDTLKRPDLRNIDTGAPDYKQEAIFPLGSETHGGEDVAIFAQGPGAHLVRGVMEQNWIFHVMQDAMRIPRCEGRGLVNCKGR
jgi:alkaline phosphatase